MIKQIIERLIEGHDLTVDESRNAVSEIMSGETTPVQTAAFLVALRQKGETSDEILGAARVMREKVRRITHNQNLLFDNCGTGGDGSGTFNISTTAAFVIAGCGVSVGKHGNRSVSSRCGSADLLEVLGANLNLEPEKVGACIDEVGIGFMFAPNLHPAMKAVAPVRKELGLRTVFNLLGPLTNPAFATHQLIGVFDGAYTENVARVASGLGVKKAMVVHSEHRIDELTTAGINLTSTSNNGTVLNQQIDPERLGLRRCRVEELQGGSIEENASITRGILDGTRGPGRDTVLLNAAAALCVTDMVSELSEGLKVAADCIDSGKARKTLNRFVEFTQDHNDA